MNNKKSFIRNSLNLGNVNSLSQEELNKIFNNIKDDNDTNNNLLIHYLHNIRNYRVLSNEMLDNINNFDSESKMRIIEEYNNLIISLNSSTILENLK
jgi:hypothetical protein